MRKVIITIGAYLFLLITLLFVLGILGGASYVLLMYPDANIAKKSAVVGGLLICALIFLIIGIAIFEALLKLASLDALPAQPQPKPTPSQ